jgi:catechol 2,3-dioxygenase-like lactoylglutathione lyase family enzyme
MSAPGRSEALASAARSAQGPVRRTTITFGIDHLQLPVPRGALPLAREFYQRHLGLVEVRAPALDRPGMLRLSIGAQRLDLVESDVVAIAPHAHLALRVIGVQHLAGDFQAAGIPVDDSPLGERSRLYVIDPFGHRLELIEAAAAGHGELGVDDAHALAVGG